MFKDAGKIKNILGIAAAAIGAAFVGMNILAKVKRGKAVYKNEPEQQNPFEGKKVIFIEDEERSRKCRWSKRPSGDSGYFRL